MSKRWDVLIVGAGQGGASAAIALRQQKLEGTIALLGDEPEPPYERPPLSKDYLAGEKPFEKLLLRAPGFWAERSIELLLGQHVTTVDPAAHRVTTAAGDTHEYGSLVWATGGSARRLTCSGHDLRGVHSVRTRADVDRLRGELAETTNVVIIGGGYIGLEAAAVLKKLGKNVTILEALDRVLARVAGEPLSRWFEAEHRAHGVVVRLRETVVCIEERDGHVSGVQLADGEVVEADMVIVGIGIIASVKPLLAAGAQAAAHDNGVVVDLQCRTSLPDIYALGDCAAHANVHANGTVVRLESIQNANDQAVIVAKAIRGGTDRYDALPWFWSNQYDVRLQTVGLSIGHDEVLVRGALAGRSFSILYLRAGKLVAIDCVNAMKDYVQARALILADRVFDRASLTDPAIPLKSLLEPAALAPPSQKG